MGQGGWNEIIKHKLVNINRRFTSYLFRRPSVGLQNKIRTIIMKLLKPKY